MAGASLEASVGNLDAKFGPPPLFAPLPAHVVLIGQWVVCAVLLALLQPPFVMSEGFETPCPRRVVVASAVTAAATWALHASGTRPIDGLRAVGAALMARG
jgi:hypothetical protein